MGSRGEDAAGEGRGARGARGRGWSLGARGGPGRGGKGKGKSGEGRGTSNPATLTGYIRGASSLEEFFHTCLSNEKILNHIHVSAGWTALGHLSRAADQHWAQDHATSLESLVQHTKRVVGTAKVDARAIANIAYGAAKVGARSGGMPALFDALAAAAAPRAAEFIPQGLANVAWAYAKAGHVAPQLFDALAVAAIARVDDFLPQDLANFAWSYAKACHVDAKLFASLARVAKGCLDQFNLQDLVNLPWAYAKVGHTDAELFASVAKSLAGRRLDSLTALHIVNVAWAFSTADQVNPKLFSALAKAAEWYVADLSKSDLASMSWAFANAGLLDTQLFASLAKSAEQYLDEFNDEELDNAEWAFSRAGQQKIVKSLRLRRKRTAAAATALADAPLDVSKCGRIVVAGGGIGGAAAAVALQSKGFEVVVLEADESFDARKQGYGLTIQRQDATQAMGINLAQDDAPSTSHYTFSAEGHILGFFGEAFGSKSKDRRESENSGRFVHIPRQMLRARIVEQVRPGTIRWASRLESFRCWSDEQDGQREGNGVTVTLTDGETLEAALLVGSDGIFSAVRRQLSLPGDCLNYVGLVVTLGIVEGTADVPLAQRRIFETVDGTTRIYAMPFTATSTMWQLSFPFAEDAARALVKDAAALKAEILRRCGGWHEPIPALLRKTPLDGMAGYPVYDRELLEPHVLRPPGAAAAAGELPKPQRRVTLMGDAAHPMTPFRAQGANQALSDAVLLADCLAEGIQRHGPQAGMDAALPLFERKMLGRSARVVVGSRDKAREMHSSVALQPARKVQREAGVDMHEAIRILRARGIGARCAADPLGLDAVVASAIESSLPDAAPAAPPAAPGDGAPPPKKRRMPEAGAAGSAPAGEAARPGGLNGHERLDLGAEGGSAAAVAKRRATLRKRLRKAAAPGMRRSRLRKVARQQYLRLSCQRHGAGDDRLWWEAHQTELRALLRKHPLRSRKTKTGRPVANGRKVHRARL